MALERRASVERSTGETAISVEVLVDGSGRTGVETGLPFLDHMLRAMAMHGRFDLTVSARGDLEVDSHHTTEDVAITLAAALAKALGDKSGIYRFGEAWAPLDESLAQAVVDLSGRGFAVVRLPLTGPALGTLPASLIRHFIETLAVRGGITLHLNARGRDDHHLAEAAFKALGLALRRACAIDPALSGGLASTKGVL